MVKDGIYLSHMSNTRMDLLYDICAYADFELLNILSSACGSSWDWTMAMWSAAKNPNLDILKFAMSKGEYGTNFGDYPLDNAIRGHCTENVRFLVENGYLNYVSSSKRSALTVALYEGTLAIVKYLVSEGCNVYDLGNTERTALHVSARNTFNPGVTRYLLQTFNLNVNAFDTYGRTPLDISKIGEAPSRCMMRILISYGAKTSANMRQIMLNIIGGLSMKRKRRDDDLEPRYSIKRSR